MNDYVIRNFNPKMINTIATIVIILARNMLIAIGQLVLASLLANSASSIRLLANVIIIKPHRDTPLLHLLTHFEK